AFRGAGVHAFAGAGQGVVGEFQVEELQALDLVAQAGGFFEFEVAGVFAHAASQVAKRKLEPRKGLESSATPTPMRRWSRASARRLLTAWRRGGAMAGFRDESRARADRD